MSRRRLDRELVARGLADDLDQAQRIIASRVVLVDGAPGLKSATMVAPASVVSLARPRQFVSRAGLKLHAALTDFGLQVAGLRCLDAGAGSGGFTDCLLQAGAARVSSVDVGYGQFDWSLRRDPRVSLYERTNLRSFLPDDGGYDLIVADLSFVSLGSMAPVIARLAQPSARCLLLIKPQFEAQVDQIDPGGLVSDPAVWQSAISSVIDSADQAGLGSLGVFPSRLKGAGGNQEFFLLARPGARTVADLPLVARSAAGRP
ncbi:MAG: TlyA family RNA methyltransferase [Actinomycetota bacterium]